MDRSRWRGGRIDIFDIMNQIKRIDFWRSYFRSLLIQAGWNYQRMMALGFLWTILPLVERLYTIPEERISLLNRHLGSFNSNPYFANYAVGSVAKLEEEHISAEEINRFKQTLIGPLGALGDSLIWIRLRPVLAILGMILALKYGILGSVIFFCFFNIFQFYLRYIALEKGYSLGSGLTAHLAGRTYPQLIRVFSMVGAILFGFFFIFCLNDFASFEKIGALLFFLAIFAFSIWGLKKSLNPGLVFIVSLLGSLGIDIILKSIVK
jgi:mannose PTS system EIID component